jgi:tetratricopeptide (TPR) repeat protein
VLTAAGPNHCCAKSLSEQWHDVLLELADCYVHALKYQEALDTLKEARPSAQKSFLEAQCNYATKKVPEAKKLLDDSLKGAPDHAPSLLLRSDIALIEDDAPAAREILERAVKAAPFDNSAHQKLSTVLLRLGEKDAAKKEAGRAKELLDLQLRSSELNNQASQHPKDVEVRKELASLARQLGIADTGGLKRYAAGVMRRDHVAEIRRGYGYRDFHEGLEAAALSRWLANRAWISAERPSVLFDLATARLVERRSFCPGSRCWPA